DRPEQGHDATTTGLLRPDPEKARPPGRDRENAERHGRPERRIATAGRRFEGETDRARTADRGSAEAAERAADRAGGGYAAREIPRPALFHPRLQHRCGQQPRHYVYRKGQVLRSV